MITVVSSLPRSGTSLLMQMLAAGGLAVLTDGQRKADEDNPRGYFEWEPAKHLSKQPELIVAAEGKAVKVISQLLWTLPRGYEYRLIFTERPLAETAASQAIMIRRRGTAGAALPPPALLAALQAHRAQITAWVRQQPHLPVCRVEYHQLLRDPAGEARRIRDFLGLPLDTGAMAAQVDPSLYRQRMV